MLRLEEATGTIRLNWILPVAPVDEDHELNGAWASILENGVERGPSSTAGKEYIIDEDDIPVGDLDVIGGVRRRVEFRPVVAEGSYVERMGPKRCLVNGIDFISEDVRYGDTASLNPKKFDRSSPPISFDNLVGQASEGALHPSRRHDERTGHATKGSTSDRICDFDEIVHQICESGPLSTLSSCDVTSGLSLSFLFSFWAIGTVFSHAVTIHIQRVVFDFKLVDVRHHLLDAL